MSQVAKLFTNGRSQAVRLPVAYRFDTKEVFIHQDPATGDVILSRKPATWQVAVVRRLIAGDTVFISRTVLRKTECVLRARYKKARAELHEFFTALLKTGNTVIEAFEVVGNTLDWYMRGADFARCAASGRLWLRRHAYLRPEFLQGGA